MSWKQGREAIDKLKGRKKTQMIMTILKQSTRYHLDEKEFEVANCYADLYCKTVIQYVNKRDQAALALRELAYEFFIINHYRSAKKFYLEMKNHFGWGVFREEDFLNLAECEEKLGHLDDALSEYERLVHYYPHSSKIRKSYRQMSRIWGICGNRVKAQRFLTLSRKHTASQPLKTH